MKEFETTKSKENINRGKNTLIVYAEYDIYTKRIEKIYFNVNDLAAMKQWTDIKKANKKLGIIDDGLILLRIGELDTENTEDDIILRGTKIKKVMEADAWEELKNYSNEEMEL
nr:MAG: hypothetical protein [Microvirus Sku114]